LSNNVSVTSQAPPREATKTDDKNKKPVESEIDNNTCIFEDKKVLIPTLQEELKPSTFNVTEHTTLLKEQPVYHDGVLNYNSATSFICRLAKHPEGDEGEIEAFVKEHVFPHFGIEQASQPKLIRILREHLAMREYAAGLDKEIEETEEKTFNTAQVLRHLKRQPINENATENVKRAKQFIENLIIKAKG
jgi:hypothetical protein